MELTGLVNNPVTLGLLVLGLLLLVSIFSIYRVSSGDHNPLVRNIEARIEAGRPPAEVAEEAQHWRVQRRRVALVIILVVVVSMVVFAPNETDVILLALRDMFVRLGGTLQQSTSGFASSVAQ